MTMKKWLERRLYSTALGPYFERITFEHAVDVTVTLENLADLAGHPENRCHAAVVELHEEKAWAELRSLCLRMEAKFARMATLADRAKQARERLDQVV